MVESFRTISTKSYGSKWREAILYLFIMVQKEKSVDFRSLCE